MITLLLAPTKKDVTKIEATLGKVLPPIIGTQPQSDRDYAHRLVESEKIITVIDFDTEQRKYTAANDDFAVIFPADRVTKADYNTFLVMVGPFIQLALSFHLDIRVFVFGEELKERISAFWPSWWPVPEYFTTEGET